jgi:hypothetical protein
MHGKCDSQNVEVVADLLARLRRALVARESARIEATVAAQMDGLVAGLKGGSGVSNAVAAPSKAALVPTKKRRGWSPAAGGGEGAHEGVVGGEAGEGREGGEGGKGNEAVDRSSRPSSTRWAVLRRASGLRFPPQPARGPIRRTARDGSHTARR